MWWLTLIGGWLIFTIWAVGAGPAAFLFRTRDLRRRTAELPELEDVPRVSVIVPARDEAAGIEQTLRTLLASDYANLQIVAIDDRSQDDTGSIMDRVAGDDSRLQVVHIQELPDGWLGKNHAMHVGAKAADGQLLLFTDGDIVFELAAIGLAVQYLRHAKIDHLTLMPSMIVGGYWETALVGFFGVLFTMGTQPWLVSTQVRFAYVGVGAFNLVRQAAYEKFGGHEPIRLDVLDDVKLGKLVKQSGHRQDVMVAGDLVSVRWQSSAWGVIRGLEKNAFASQDYSLGKLIAATLVFIAVVIVPYFSLLFLHDPRSYGYAASVILAHVVYGALSRTFGGGWRIVPALPMAALGMLFAFWRSAVITLRQGGVRWRDTFYPLETLRRNVYR